MLDVPTYPAVYPPFALPIELEYPGPSLRGLISPPNSLWMAVAVSFSVVFVNFLANPDLV